MSLARIKKDSVAYDDLIVNDSFGNRVTGLLNSDFTKYLYNPGLSDVSGSIAVTVEEMGDGLYRLNFRPDTIGVWTILITNTNYFSWGKTANYFCVENLNDNLASLINRNYNAITNPTIGGNTVRTQILSERYTEVVERLTKYRAAETAILEGAQSYSIGNRTLTRADLDQISKMIKKLEAEQIALTRNGALRIQRTVPRDQ